MKTTITAFLGHVWSPLQVLMLIVSFSMPVYLMKEWRLFCTQGGHAKPAPTQQGDPGEVAQQRGSSSPEPHQQPPVPSIDTEQLQAQVPKSDRLARCNIQLLPCMDTN